MRVFVLSVVSCLALTVPAVAQTRRPLPPIVVDLRGFYSGLGRDLVTADDLLVLPDDMPGRALGAVAGVHVYPLRGRSMSLGLGGEAVFARAGAQTTPEDDDETLLPAVNQRLRGLSGMMSLNFGSRDGWSYVSAGMGPLSFATYTGDTPPADAPPSQMTINFGAGARWFAWRRIAFAVDVRFYQTRPEVPSGSYGGRQRASIRVLSAGISVR